jgi:hypothetical protein
MAAYRTAKAARTAAIAYDFSDAMNSALNAEGHTGLTQRECLTYRDAGYTPAEAANAVLHREY